MLTIASRGPDDGSGARESRSMTAGTLETRFERIAQTPKSQPELLREMPKRESIAPMASIPPASEKDLFIMKRRGRVVDREVPDTGAYRTGVAYDVPLVPYPFEEPREIGVPPVAGAKVRGHESHLERSGNYGEDRVFAGASAGKDDAFFKGKRVEDADRLLKGATRLSCQRLCRRWPQGREVLRYLGLFIREHVHYHFEKIP